MDVICTLSELKELALVDSLRMFDSHGPEADLDSV